MRLVICTLLAVSLAACGRGAPASLPIGSAAPDFSLPGIDGQTHTLAEFAASPVLVVAFTCNHCPASQRLEGALNAIVRDYGSRGVAVVAINPDNDSALRYDDLSQSDVGESLDDMKTRAAFAQIAYLYLSDGATQQVARAYRVTATPEIFVFDRARRLRLFADVIDGDVSAVRSAIESSLDGRAAVMTATLASSGSTCPVSWLTDAPKADAERKAIAAEPVSVQPADAAALSALRKNGTGKLLLVNFWATWCGPCVTEFPELEATYRMYHARGLEFVAVSSNDPEERPGVIEFLQKQHASHRNLQFGTPDVYALQAAFDPAMPSSVPFTVLLAPNGDVLYQELGVSDIPKLRRAILANLPDDRASSGQRAYWARN
jgi:thiol-disulfide isomerase/thioredoxin